MTKQIRSLNLIYSVFVQDITSTHVNTLYLEKFKVILETFHLR